MLSKSALLPGGEMYTMPLWQTHGDLTSQDGSKADRADTIPISAQPVLSAVTIATRGSVRAETLLQRLGNWDIMSISGNFHLPRAHAPAMTVSMASHATLA